MTKKKNVIKLCLILGITVLITIIICNIYRNYEGGKSNSSYISKYVSTIQYNELSRAGTEWKERKVKERYGFTRSACPFGRG